MKHEKLAQQIRHLAADTASQTPDCPDDHQISAFVQGIPGPEGNLKLAVHIAACDFCLARAGRLNRLMSWDSGEAVSDIELARARRLGPGSMLPKQLTHWAAAAVVVLALTVIFSRNLSEIAGQTLEDGVPPVVEAPQLEDRQSRNLDSNALRPQILAPPEGENIDPGKTLFRWTEIPGSLYYDIRLVSGDGEMIWQDRVEDNEWKLPGHLQLLAGEEYFVRVDAYLAEAKNVNSRHVLFKVGEER